MKQICNQCHNDYDVEEIEYAKQELAKALEIFQERVNQAFIKEQERVNQALIKEISRELTKP